MLDFLFGTTRKIRNLSSIHQIEKTTESYMGLPIEQLQKDHKFFTDAAKDAGKKSKMIEDIYQAQSAIESAKIQANSTGVQALNQVQQHRLKYQSLKSKLLDAAKG
jgi:hypothetical protein